MISNYSANKQMSLNVRFFRCGIAMFLKSFKRIKGASLRNILPSQAVDTVSSGGRAILK